MPFIMINSISFRFREMTRLYHFTRFDTACSILESWQMRFGKMYEMNDLIESGRKHFGRILLD